jgi:hypothetical protein
MTQPTRQEFLRDIAITAAEGGISYWASLTKYRWSSTDRGGEAPDDMLPFPQVQFIAAEDPSDFVLEELMPSVQSGPYRVNRGPEITLTPEVMERALQRIADPSVATDDLGWNNKDRQRVIGAAALNDACDIDAGDADNIVQIAIFGKLVFG